jgi:hypothetical protein
MQKTQGTREEDEKDMRKGEEKDAGKEKRGAGEKQVGREGDEKVAGIFWREGGRE